MPRSLRRRAVERARHARNELHGFVERVAIERPHVLDRDRVVGQVERRGFADDRDASFSLPSSNTLSWAAIWAAPTKDPPAMTSAATAAR